MGELFTAFLCTVNQTDKLLFMNHSISGLLWFMGRISDESQWFIYLFIYFPVAIACSLFHVIGE